MIPKCLLHIRGFNSFTFGVIPDPSIETSSVVSLNNVSSIDIAGADSAIVRALEQIITQ